MPVPLATIQAKVNQPYPSRTEPNKTEPNHTITNQTEPYQTKLNLTEPTDSSWAVLRMDLIFLMIRQQPTTPIALRRASKGLLTSVKYSTTVRFLRNKPPMDYTFGAKAQRVKKNMCLDLSKKAELCLGSHKVIQLLHSVPHEDHFP